jgi:integrase
VWRDGEWVARFMGEVDGERVRRWVPLGTDSKQVARRKLARLLAAPDAAAAEGKRLETFEEAARASVKRQAAEGLATWKDRLHRLEAWAFPTFGHLAVNALRPPHVLEALEACQAAGKSRRTITHLKIDVSTVLDQLWREEQIPENVARKVRVPKNAHVDERRRVVLTDEEFDALMASESLAAELATMAFTSRTFGGMRTSDLHAWDWKHVDTVTWLDAHVPRPKTKSSDRLALPAVFVPLLKAWWEQHGCPPAGPVFPVRRGPRAGERKQGKISYADQLREALWKAGIVRPMAGFQEAQQAWRATGEYVAREAAELRASGLSGRALARALAPARAALQEAEDAIRRCCEIQAGSEDLRPLDFHSFRRAFATGLAAAGLNVQTSMQLAGHRNSSTHMRYVRQIEVLEIPTDALPKLIRAQAVPKSLLPKAPQTGDGPLTSVREPSFGVGHRRLELRANGLRDGRDITQESSGSIFAAGEPVRDEASRALKAHARQYSAPKVSLLRRAADGALAAYLAVLAAGFAGDLLGAPPLTVAPA